MRVYRHDIGPLAYASPVVKLFVLGSMALALSGVLALGCCVLAPAADVLIIGAVEHTMGQAAAFAFWLGLTTLFVAVATYFLMSDRAPAQDSAGLVASGLW